MANYSSLKSTIDSNVRTNGTEAITGAVLNTVLNAMVNSLGAGYQYMGVAIPSTNPGTPDQNVFYIAGTEGTYTNFGGIVVANEVAALVWNGSWSKQNTGIKFVSVSQNTSTGHTDITIGDTTTPVASLEDVSQLGQQVDENASSLMSPIREIGTQDFQSIVGLETNAGYRWGADGQLYEYEYTTAYKVPINPYLQYKIKAHTNFSATTALRLVLKDGSIKTLTPDWEDDAYAVNIFTAPGGADYLLVTAWNHTGIENYIIEEHFEKAATDDDLDELAADVAAFESKVEPIILKKSGSWKTPQWIRNDGYRYGADGSLVAGTGFTAIRVNVSGGGNFLVSGNVMEYSTYAIRYLLSDNTVTSESTLVPSTSQPLKERLYTAPATTQAILFTTPTGSISIFDVKLWENEDNPSIGTSEVSIQNKKLSQKDNFVIWGGGTLNKSNRYMVFVPDTNSNSGIQTQNFVSPANLLTFYADLESINCTARFFILGKKGDNTANYIALQSITQPGKYRIDIDLAYQAVYNELDTSKGLTFGLIVTATTTDGAAIVINEIFLEEKTTAFTSDTPLNVVLDELQETSASAKNKAESITLGTLPIVGSDGGKYYIQVSNGQIVPVPAIPNNVVLIGNSLLFGWPKDNQGWVVSQDNFGMAASDNTKDYYNLVKTYLQSKTESLTTYKVYGSPFERAESLAAQETWMEEELLPHLSSSVQLVIIQLGDNVNENTSIAFFEQAAKNLAQYIRQNAPNARVAWVAEWYATPEKQTYISNACSLYGLSMIDISDLYGVTANRAAIGDVITLPDNTTRVIEDAGVASHPSNTGMQKIAERIINALF